MTISIFFFVIALLYAAVGFGGGSSYAAVLAVFGYPAAAIPVVSLVCNIAATGAGWVVRAVERHPPPPAAFALVTVSAPAAFLGGFTPIRPFLFFVLLGVALVASGVLLVLPPPNKGARDACLDRPGAGPAIWIGGGVGYFSGLVGIGGGIFLAPFLYYIGWSNSRRISATTTVFILVNSVAALAGQLFKGAAGAVLRDELLLPAIVLAGAAIGAWSGIRVFSQRSVIKLTGICVLVAGLRCLWVALERA